MHSHSEVSTQEQPTSLNKHTNKKKYILIRNFAYKKTLGKKLSRGDVTEERIDHQLSQFKTRGTRASFFRGFICLLREVGCSCVSVLR